MQLCRTGNDHIPDAGQNQHLDPFFHTVFHEDVAVMTMDPTGKHDFRIVDRRQIVEDIPYLKNLFDLEFPGQSVLFDQAVHPKANIVNDVRFFAGYVPKYHLFARYAHKTANTA